MSVPDASFGVISMGALATGDNNRRSRPRIEDILYGGGPMNEWNGQTPSVVFKDMKVRREVLGDDHVKPRPSGTITEEHCRLSRTYYSLRLGRNLSRPGLARRDRSIAVLSSLIALGTTQS